MKHLLAWLVLFCVTPLLAKPLNMAVLQNALHSGVRPASADTQALLTRNSLNETTSLLPKDSIFLSTLDQPQLSDLVDEALINILRVKTGQEICKNALEVHNIDMYVKIGLSEKVIERAGHICRGQNNGRDVNPQELSRYFMRKPYLFAFTAEEDVVIDSWTLSWTLLKPTLLVINPNTITEEHLYRMLIHELYMGLDIKSSFPYRTYAQMQNIPHACFILSALHEPVIRYTLNTYRAFQFENRVMQELGFTTEMWPAVPTLDDLKQVAVTLLPLFNSVKVRNERTDFKHLYFQCYEQTSLDEKWHILAQEKTSGSIENPVTLLEYLSTPQIQKIVIEGGFDPGPRPNIGGGTGLKSLKTVDGFSAKLTKSASAVEEQKLKQLIKRLDDSKSLPTANTEKPDYLKGPRPPQSTEPGSRPAK